MAFRGGFGSRGLGLNLEKVPKAFDDFFSPVQIYFETLKSFRLLLHFLLFSFRRK